MGLTITYEDVRTFVRDFDCGIYFTPEFINANPDLEVKLALKMYNGEEDTKGTVIGKEYVFNLVAQNGDKYYASLQAAVDAAQSGDTIVLLDDVTLTETLTISAEKTVTLNLNGNTIGQEKECTESYSMIENKGSLTITGDGKISFKDTGAGDPNYGWGSYAITNYGLLTIESGTIEGSATATKHANYAIQSVGTTIVNGGKIYNPSNYAIRLWANSEITESTVTINNGEVIGTRAVWLQVPGSNPTKSPKSHLTVNGGTLTGSEKDGYKLAIYSYSYGDSMANTKITITGGTLNGDVALTGGKNKDAAETLTITGGKINGFGGSVYSYAADNVAKKTMSITGGTFSDDISNYVAEDHICISKDETSFEVIEKPAAAVIPETVPGVESGSDNSGNSIIEAPTGNVNDKTGDGGFVEISSTKEEVSVSFVITGATVTEGNDGNKVITLGEDAEITANYDVQPVSDGTSNVGTFQLSIKIDNVTKPLPVIDATVDETIMEGHDTPVKSVLAMITALGADRNSNLASGDGNKITIIFTVPISAIENLNNIAAYHVDKDGIKTKAEMGKPEKSGYEYIIHVHGKHFSSYVLVEEEPEEEEIISNGGGKDTGSGNYQYYPRDVPTNGIVDFGTSKVVTGIELPAGSSGKVTLNTKPTFAMPENGYYAFEIDAPGYNLEAKINGGISFKLTVSEIEAAGWTAKDIVLYHGTVAEDGTINWEALPTNLVKNENGIAYYKSAINGCSPFYIGFVKDGSVVNTEVVDPVTPPTETPDVPGEVLPEIPPVDEPETPATPAPLFAVLSGLGAAVVLRRK